MDWGQIYTAIKKDPILTTVIGGLILAGLLWLFWRIFRRKSDGPRPSPQEARADRNRQAMLDKVRAIWITDFLEQSLEKEARVALDLQEDTGAVTRALQLRSPSTHRLPQEKHIIDVYDEQDDHLLILGNPGSGKTTLLLELTRNLLDRANQDSRHPIPVVFPLSSWAEHRRPLADWLVEELHQRYDVSHAIGQAWVERKELLLLLDGLDEVAEAHRADCVEAINSFRQGRGLLPLVVCCRSKDYEAIGKKLQLKGAVEVQPLTRDQVNTYLRQLGDRLAGLRRAIGDNDPLRLILDTPLMLHIMTLAYEGQSDVTLDVGGSEEERRGHLFETYVDRMFARRKVKTPYSRPQTLHWLAWLASQMVQQSQTMFYIEGLQPDWLPQEQHWRFRLGAGLVGGPVFGLIGGLVFGLAFGLTGGLVFGLIGLVFGFGVGLGKRINIAETVRWSWSDARLGVGLIGGLGVGLVFGLGGGFDVGLGVGLGGGLVLIILGGLSLGELETKTVPNQGMRRSARNALVFGLGVGLSLGLGVGLSFGLIGGLGFGLIGGLIGGLGGGLIVGLESGGKACLQHFALRFLLVWNGSAPWSYPAFLDSAVDRLFLRKVGGGYVFIHRMLLEYFAGLDASVERE